MYIQLGHTSVSQGVRLRRPRRSRSARGQNAARQGPVFITDRGRPAHVLLTIEDYRRLTEGNMSLAEALTQPGNADFDFEPPRIGGGIFKPVRLMFLLDTHVVSEL